MTKSGKSRPDKIVAGSSSLKQRSKEHKHENHSGRNSQSNTKHTFCSEPVMGHAFYKTRPFMGNNVRHMGAGKGVQDKHCSHNHKWRPQGSPGCFKQ